jgi:hypothetical protein
MDDLKQRMMDAGTAYVKAKEVYLAAKAKYEALRNEFDATAPAGGRRSRRSRKTRRRHS